MMRGARAVTCRVCGCLNFSVEHEVCDKCRSKTPTSRPTARLIPSASSTKTKEDLAHSLGKKRKYNETTTIVPTSNTEKPKLKQLVAKKQPDIIDLISDDDDEDDVKVDPPHPKQEKQRKDDLETIDKEIETHAPSSLFKSRVFPSVVFTDRDFPSMETGVMLRKEAAEKVLVKTPSPAEVTITNDVLLSNPNGSKSPENKEQGNEMGENQEATAMERVETGEKMDTKRIKSVSPIKADAFYPPSREKEMEQMTQMNHEDLLFQSRIFDSIEFQGADFVTIFDDLALARRSFPPMPATTITITTATTSASQVETSTSTVDASISKNHKLKELTEPEKKPSTAAAIDKCPATNINLPVTPSVAETVPRKLLVAAPVVEKTKIETEKMPPTSSTASASRPVSIPSAPVPASSSSSSPKPPSAKDTGVKNISATPKTILQPGVNQSTASTTAGRPPITPGTRPPTSTPFVANPSLVNSTTKVLPKIAIIPPKLGFSTPKKPKITTESCISVPDAERIQTKDKINVLVPKKKPLEDPQRSQTHSFRESNDLVPSNGTFISGKSTATVRDMTPIEPPVLGYCRPEFLEFMRECGDEDVEDEDDPEEVRRSQLKLLDVVDLRSNLSDSETSASISPLSTPRVKGSQGIALPVRQQSGQGTTGHVTGSGLSYVSTINTERKRAVPERVLCELCEERGLVSRLIRCPKCTKYYHKKCAKENGDENICWNCELGSMIDDSALEEEHAKHSSGYLAYLKSIRRSIEESEEREEGEEREDGEEEEEEEGERDEIEAGKDVEKENLMEEGEENESFRHDSRTKSAGTRWKEFIGDATADIDASYLEVTSRIVQELGDDEKRRLYSRGFVSREEFEAQMTEVEEFYINEEARLQQLEREKALEAKKVAESKKTLEETIVTELPAEDDKIANGAAGQSGTGTGNGAMAAPTTAVASLEGALATCSSTLQTSSPKAVALATQSSLEIPSDPVLVPTPAPIPSAMFATPLKATVDVTSVTGTSTASWKPS